MAKPTEKKEPVVTGLIQSYSFPEYGEKIEASSQEEAQEKLKELLKSNSK